MTRPYTAPAFTQEPPNAGQLLRNVSADAMRAAVSSEGKLTYEGLQSAEDAIRRAEQNLRAAKKAVRELAKPVRAKRAAERRRGFHVVRDDDLAIPAMGA